MGLIYPDNDHRKNRLIELGTDISNDLEVGIQDYEQFRKLLPEINDQIARVYRDANLPAPDYQAYDLMKEAGLDAEVKSRGDAVVQVLTILSDAVGFSYAFKYFAPAATKLLCREGAISADLAARIVVKTTIPVIGKEITITAGELGGKILGGVAAGIAAGAIDLGVDVVEGAVAKAELVKGLHDVYHARTGTKIQKDKAATLLESLRAVNAALVALDGADIELDEAAVQRLIHKCAEPSVVKEEAITVSTVTAELARLDTGRGSWTNEDSAP